jgi:carbonic anhydrase
MEPKPIRAFDSLEQSLKDDVAWIKSHPYMRKELAENTFGLLYDLKTGEVTEIDVDGKGNVAKSEL